MTEKMPDADSIYVVYTVTNKWGDMRLRLFTESTAACVHRDEERQTHVDVRMVEYERRTEW